MAVNDYAKNLVGNYDKTYLDENRKVLKDSYSTNWKRLQQTYDNLVQSLEQDRQRNQLAFNKGLTNVSENSFDNMKNSMSNLATRGLTGSGAVDLATQQDTTVKGQAVDKLLSSLGSDMTANIGNLVKANTNLAEQQSGLNTNLADALAGVGDKDLGNQWNYMETVSDITSSKDARDAEAAIRAARTNASKGLDEEEQEWARRKLLLSLTYDLDPETLAPNADAIDYQGMYKEAKTDEERKQIQKEWDESNRQKALAATMFADVNNAGFADLLNRVQSNADGSVYRENVANATESYKGLSNKIKANNDKISKIENEIAKIKSSNDYNRGTLTKIKSKENKLKSLIKNGEELANQRDNLFNFDKISGTGRQNYEYFEDLFK